MAEIRETVRVARLHQIRENIRVEQDDIERIADQSLLSPGAVDLFDECAYVFAWRHDPGKGLRVKWFRTAFPG